MSDTSRQQYLESKVLTASQPQLHIMLLDGALRFGQLAQKMWKTDKDFLAVDPLLEKMTNIVDELTHGTSTATEESTKELSQQFEEQYAFIYRELATCRVNQEVERLDTCLKLLSFQRETWKLAIEKLEAETAAPAASPIVPHMHTSTEQTPAGFSLEA